MANRDSWFLLTSALDQAGADAGALLSAPLLVFAGPLPPPPPFAAASSAGDPLCPRAVFAAFSGELAISEGRCAVDDFPSCFERGSGCSGVAADS